jgi:hypothetical protein
MATADIVSSSNSTLTPTRSFLARRMFLSSLGR